VGQHRKPQRRRRRWPFVALGAAVLIAAAGVVVYQSRQGPGCTPLPVAVAVDPSVVDPIARALATTPDDIDPCARYEIVAARPTLAGEIGSASPGLPAVWIPQSSLALAPLGEKADSAVRRGPSLASSPIVLAVPTADAARYGDPAQPVNWTTALTNPQPPGLPDPDAEPGGLAALTALRTAIGDDGGRPKPAFVAAVLALHGASPESTEAGFSAMAEKGAAARSFVTSELAVVRHDAQAAAAPTGAPGPSTEGIATGPTTAPPADPSATALQLADSTAVLDFPLVRVDQPQPDSPELTRAVDALEKRLLGPAGQQAFAAVGLRAPDGTRPGTAAAPGMLPAERTAGTAPDPTAAVDTLRLWSALTLQSRILAVIDTSGSMAAHEGPTDRIGLAAAAAQGGLTLFPDSSEVGLWSFSSEKPDGQAWDELVPIGKLTEPVGPAPSRRAALASLTDTLRERLGGKTALYSTVIAAVREVRAGYRPGASNAVVLITDGRNEVDGGIDLPTAVQTLRAEADPTRPVALIAIGIGPDSDAEALRQLSGATGGAAYTAQNPQDIRAVFLDALSQRVCRPDC
jgi:Ca-activated chloride channel family protein